MIQLTLPDGAIKQYTDIVTGLDVAKDIGTQLAKNAVAIRVNGALQDLTIPISSNASIEIITRSQEEGLEILRHDAAHVFAEAVKELYPDTQITIGPAIQDGFYYDIYRETPLSSEDFGDIEKRMRQIVDRDEKIIREVWDRDEAIAFFKDLGEHFKAEIIQDLPAEESITLYRQGNFIDLCRGPHLPSTKYLGKAFKLMKVAGAYWRGDSNNQMLQRIYGTAWATEKQLKDYIYRLEEAQKRDHRKLGKELDLFHLQDEAPGCVFWHSKGWQIYLTLQEYIRRRLREDRYVEVNSPIMVDLSLWEKSGHAEKFSENMFMLDDDNRKYAIKPMNCPCHVQIFNRGIKSYRDLPLRMAEFGYCHRNEASGALQGLTRVRAMVQDDGHIFCTEDQILEETRKFSRLLISMYCDFGFTEDDIEIKFADRPEVRAGSDVTWDKAEEALRKAAEASGLKFSINSGEGAFYGPKLEFHLKDAIGRSWQCGTLQVDFVLPGRLNASYIGEDGEKHQPVMIHRAVLGSLERFIGILIEHYNGHFPLWLAPVQAVVAPVTSEANDYAHEISNQLQMIGMRAQADIRNEKINYKIREHSMQKIPVILVIGQREIKEKTVVIRRFAKKDQEVLALTDAIAKLKKEAIIPEVGR